MIDYLQNPVFLLAMTFGVYLLACFIRRSTGMAIFNPILLSVVAIIAFLWGNDIEYASYSEAGRMIDFWLKPAVVALGVPLYKQLSVIRRQLVPVLAAELAGCVAGIVSVVLIARLLGATDDVIVSLAAKSVTAPIAMEVTSTLGGIPALTAAVVVSVGIFGGMAGFQLMRVSRVNSPIAQGLSMGTAAHAVGTSAAMEVGERYAAFSSLGLIINGMLTALLAPTVLYLLGYSRML